MTPYYQDNAVTIYHGDCREILPQLEPVDLVLTDPPYNYNKKYGLYADNLTDEEYAEFSQAWFIQSVSISKQQIVFPGAGNLAMWFKIAPPWGIGCWFKPGNPSGGGLFQWCEWEPWLLYGGRMSCSDVIRAPISEQHEATGHPCPKPLKLFSECIQRAQHKDFILDPFMGSGTTLRAAKDLGRKAIGIEIEEKYCEVAAKRMAQEVLSF